MRRWITPKCSQNGGPGDSAYKMAMSQLHRTWATWLQRQWQSDGDHIYVDRAHLPPRLYVLVFSTLCSVLCWVLGLEKNWKRPGYQGSERQNPLAYLNYNRSLYWNALKSYGMNKSITRNIKIKIIITITTTTTTTTLLDFSEVQLFSVFQSRD